MWQIKEACSTADADGEADDKQCASPHPFAIQSTRSMPLLFATRPNRFVDRLSRVLPNGFARQLRSVVALRPFAPKDSPKCIWGSSALVVKTHNVVESKTTSTVDALRAHLTTRSSHCLQALARRDPPILLSIRKRTPDRSLIIVF